MNKATYDKINEFCNTYDGVLVQVERDYVLRKFLDSYYEAIDKYYENNGKMPTEEYQNTIIDSLLNKNTLLSYVDSSKKYYSEFRSTLETEFKNFNNKSDFWKDLGMGILVNFIYSIILILIFWVAKDQIYSWLMQLAK